MRSLLCLFQIWWIQLFRKPLGFIFYTYGMGVMLKCITSTSGRGRREKQVKETQKDRNTERQKHRKTTGRMCKAKPKSRSSGSRTQKGNTAPRSKVTQTNKLKHKIHKQNICNLCCKDRNAKIPPTYWILLVVRMGWHQLLLSHIFLYFLSVRTFQCLFPWLQYLLPFKSPSCPLKP